MQLDLEAIVREVMRRLERELAPADGTPAPNIGGEKRVVFHQVGPEAKRKGSRLPATMNQVEKTSPENDSRPVPSPGTLEISERVVTWTRLKDRLAGIRQVIFPPGAVLTPSVRDELRKRKIQWETASQPAASAAGLPHDLLVAAARGAFDAEATMKTVAAEAAGAEPIGCGHLAEVVEQLRGRIAGGGPPAVLLTTEPAAAICLANRFRELRAVWGTDRAAVEQGCQSVGANVLVIDPRRNAANEMRSMVRQFLQGSHQCPPDWQAVLAGVK